MVTGRPTRAPLEGSLALLLGRYDRLLPERGQIQMLARRHDEPNFPAPSPPPPMTCSSTCCPAAARPAGNRGGD